MTGSNPFFYDHCQFIRRTDQLWINYKILQLNRAIIASAASIGVEPVDIYDASFGHELCNIDGAEGFLNGIVMSNWGDSLHPTAYGHEVIADYLTAALGEDPPGQSLVVMPGETVSTEFMLDGGPSASFSTSWPGSDVVMSLTSPRGRTIDRSTAAGDVFHRLTAGRELYKIINPEVGTWTVRLFGADVPAAGEPTTLRFFEMPVPNQDPVAQIAMTIQGTTVTLDASGSSDPDGTVTDYFWEFGDGATATGSQVTHTFTTPGTYRVTLVVEDDQGGMGFATADQDVVVGP